MKGARSILPLAILIFVLPVVVGALTTLSAQGSPANDEAARIQQGFQIAPVPLRRGRGFNRDLVGLGSYIVNAQGGCNDCHTNPPYAPGGDPFEGEPEQINVAGYLAGGMEFGPVVSANITPDENGRPHGFTWSEFRSTIRNGHEPGEDELLQVMPWPVFRKMTDRDLRAVYEYLRAIPSIDTGDDG